MTQYRISWEHYGKKFTSDVLESPGETLDYHYLIVNDYDASELNVQVEVRSDPQAGWNEVDTDEVRGAI